MQGNMFTRRHVQVEHVYGAALTRPPLQAAAGRESSRSYRPGQTLTVTRSSLAQLQLAAGHRWVLKDQLFLARIDTQPGGKALCACSRVPVWQGQGQCPSEFRPCCMEATLDTISAIPACPARPL